MSNYKIEMNKVIYEGLKCDKNMNFDHLLEMFKFGSRLAVEKCVVCDWIDYEGEMKQCHPGSRNYCCDDCLENVKQDKKKICENCSDSDSASDSEEEDESKDEESSNKDEEDSSTKDEETSNKDEEDSSTKDEETSSDKDEESSSKERKTSLLS